MSKKIYLCQNCGAINRVDLEQKSKLVAHCGKCQATLETDHSLHKITEQKLEKIIKHAELPVVVDVFADWCGPCKSYAPIFEEVSKKLETKAEFYKLNSEQSPNFSAKFNIRGIPATLIFSKGELIKSQSGLLNEPQLASMVDHVIRGA